MPAGVKLEQIQPLEAQVVHLLSSLLSSAGDSGSAAWSSVALSSVPLLLAALESGAESSVGATDLLSAVASAVKSTDAAVAVMNNSEMLDAIFSMLQAAVDDWDAAAVSAGMQVIARCAAAGDEQCQILFERGAHLLALRAASDAIASAPAHADAWGPGSTADISATCMQCATSLVQAVPAAAFALNQPEVATVGFSFVTVVGRGISRVCASDQPYAPEVMHTALGLMNAVQKQVCSVESSDVSMGVSPSLLSASCRKVVAAALKSAVSNSEYAVNKLSGLQLAKALRVNCTTSGANVVDEDALDDVRETFKQLGARQLMVTCVSKSGVDGLVVAAASAALASIEGGAGGNTASGIATEVRKLALTLRKQRMVVHEGGGATDAPARTAAVRLVRATTRLQTAVNKLSTSLAVDTALTSAILDVVVRASIEAVLVTIANVHTLGEVAACEFEGDADVAGSQETTEGAGVADGAKDELTIALQPQIGLDAARSTLASLLQCVSRAWVAGGANATVTPEVATELLDKYQGPDSDASAVASDLAETDTSDEVAAAGPFGLIGDNADCIARLAVLLVQFVMRWFTMADDEAMIVPADAESQAVSMLTGAREVVSALLNGSDGQRTAHGWQAVWKSGLLPLLAGLAREDIQWPEEARPAAQAALTVAVQTLIQRVALAAEQVDAPLPAGMLQVLPSLLLLCSCAPSNNLSNSLTGILSKALVSDQAAAHAKSGLLAQLWALAFSMLHTPVQLHAPCFFVEAADCSIALYEGEEAIKAITVADAPLRLGLDFLVGAISTPPLGPGQSAGAFDAVMLDLMAPIAHTAIASLQFVKERHAASGGPASPSKARATAASSVDSPDASTAVDGDDDSSAEEVNDAASWWFQLKPCVAPRELSAVLSLPAVTLASHMDLDHTLASVSCKDAAGLPQASAAYADTPQGEAFFAPAALAGLKRMLRSTATLGVQAVQLLRRMAGVSVVQKDGSFPIARDRVQRLVEGGMLAAVAAGLAAGAAASSGSSGAAKEDADPEAVAEKGLFTIECVRFLADVSMGPLECPALGGDAKGKASLKAIDLALLGDASAGIGVKQCGLSETSLAVLGGALKRLTAHLAEDDVLIPRAAVLVAALGRVFESYSTEGFLKAIREAAAAATAAISADAVPQVASPASAAAAAAPAVEATPGGTAAPAGKASPPVPPAAGGTWDALTKKLEVLQRVCVNVDMDAIPEVSVDVLCPLVQIAASEGFKQHRAHTETVVFALARCGDNAHNLAHCVAAGAHVTFTDVLRLYMADVILVDLCITGLRPLTISLQFLPQLKQCGVVPLVTEAAMTHVNAILQTPPHRQLADDEEDEYPRIAHYTVQILANIACDKEIEKASDLLGVTMDGESAFEDEELSGGVLRVVLADGVEALRTVMLAHISNPRILEDAMCALSNMAFTTDAVRLAIGRQCALTVVESLKVFDSDPYLFSMALRAVGNLTRCDENIVSVMAFGVGNSIASGMRKCAEHPDALQVAADVVGNLASIDEKHLDKVEAVKALKEGIKRRKVTDGSATKDMEQDELLQLDLAIAVAEWLYDEGVPQVLAATMRANYSESNIVSACLRAIQYLTETPSVLLRLTKHTSLAQDVVFVLRSCDFDAELCLRGSFLLAQMLRPFVADKEEQEAIAAVTRQACIDAGVQTVLLSILETHRREEYVVSQLIKISNLASKGEHLKDMCTAAVQMKTHNSLLWIAERSATQLVSPHDMGKFAEAGEEGGGPLKGDYPKSPHKHSEVAVPINGSAAGVVMANLVRFVAPRRGIYVSARAHLYRLYRWHVSSCQVCAEPSRWRV
jgi:hypothetical protein